MIKFQYILSNKRTLSQQDQELSGESKIHGQTFCPLFVVFKKCSHNKKPVSTSFASYLRTEWNKLAQDTTEVRQFSQPFHFLQPTPHLFTFRLSPHPRLLPPPSILDWRVPYHIERDNYKMEIGNEY